MANGLVKHCNAKARQSKFNWKNPKLSKNVKAILKTHSDEMIFKKAFRWLGYNCVTMKEYYYVLKKLKNNELSLVPKL